MSFSRVQARQQPLVYGCGGAGAGIFTTVPSVLLLFFLVRHVHLDPVGAGLVLLLPKLFAAALDLVVGIGNDRFSGLLGTRGSFGFGSVTAGMAIAVLFALPQHFPGNPFLPAALIALGSLGYSVFIIPFTAALAHGSFDAFDRRRLVATRVAGALAGTLMAATLAPVVAGRYGYPAMGIVVGGSITGLMGIAAILRSHAQVGSGPSLAEPRARHQDGSSAVPTLVAMLSRLLPFSLLMSAVGAFTALLPFLIADAGLPDYLVGLAMLINLTAALASTFVWRHLLRDRNDALIWLLSAALMFIGVVTVGSCPRRVGTLLIGMAVGGAGFGGAQVVGLAWIAQFSADVRFAPRVGFISGVWMSVEKMTLAAGPALAAVCLSFAAANGAPNASQTAMLMTAPALCILAAGSILFFLLKTGPHSAR